MIKLVVSDIDGTLIPEGTDRLDPEIFRIIRKLKKKGILFAAASGRQYSSMHYLFREVENEILFISENGSNVMQEGRNLSTEYMDPEAAREVVRYLRTLPGCTTVLSVPERMYMEETEDTVRPLIENGYHSEIRMAEDLLPLCERTNKLCVYCRAGSDQIIDDLTKRFGGKLNTMIAGEKWVDFMSLKSDKGNALAALQEKLGITEAETMAFGDNCNDIGMLSHAAESYAVANAHPDVIAAARHTAPSNLENGVLRTINELLLSERRLV